LRWLNNVSCLILSFPLITSGVWCMYMCIDKSGLAQCLYLRVVFASLLVVFLWRWLKICTIPQPISNFSKDRYLKKCPKPCWPIRNQDTWTKYTPVTLLSQCKLALTGRNTLFVLKIIGAPKQFKNWPSRLFRPWKVHKREKFFVSDFEFFTIL
jgi:hypothetical protein